MSSWGVWRVTPAVVLSKTCSKLPPNRETSVLVPPYRCQGYLDEGDMESHGVSYHVKTDDRPAVLVRVRSPCESDISTCRSAENCFDASETKSPSIILPLKDACRKDISPLPAGQAAIAHHKITLDGVLPFQGPIEAVSEAVNVAPRYRGQICICRGAETSADQLD